MSRYVILLTDASEPPEASLLDALCAAGVAAFVEGLREAELEVAAAKDASAKQTASDSSELPLPIAVLYEVFDGADIEDVYAVVSHAVTTWPSVSLVACRRTRVDHGLHHPRIIESSTLKRLGFTSIADDPWQLPVLLREIEEHGGLAEPRTRVDLIEALLPPTVELSRKVRAEVARSAFTLVASLHFTNDQKSTANSALLGLDSLVSADRWVIYLVPESNEPNTTMLEPLALCRSQRGKKYRKSDRRRHVLDEAIGLAGQESSAAREAITRMECVKSLELNHRILAIPLLSGDRVIGVIEAMREGKRSRAFKRTEIDLLKVLALPIGYALSNALRIDEAERLSQTDDLTKLHNARYLRHYLVSEVKRARRYGSSVSIIFLDLDDFKHINDEHGHLVGSHVLMEMAAVILTSVRDTDVVARYGGDEFVVILPESSLSQATVVAGRIREKIESQVFTGGRRLKLQLTASFGVAEFPEHAQSPQQLVACADSAMYEAKAAGKNCVRILSSFAPENVVEQSPANS